MDLIAVKEGNTRFFIPRTLPGSFFPPSSAPVFFNPRMEFSRDATVLLLGHEHCSSYLDAMGATGVRGLRVARECGIPVTINDRSRVAIELIHKNVEISAGPVEVTHSDVNVLLASRHFDAVDLDPYGSPAPFVDAAARCAGRFLFLTATDTAPLCGAHLNAGIRRYFAVPRNTEYHAEIGLRILLGFVVREVVKYDRGLLPLFCYAREHYVRLHLKLLRGAVAADQTVSRIGFILQCPSCPNRTEAVGLVPVPELCDYCGTRLIPIGPLWLGGVQDRDLLERMETDPKTSALGTSGELSGLISTCRQELPTGGFYDYHRLAQYRHLPPPPIQEFMEHIAGRGFQVTRTHYSGTGIKTDAPLPIVLEALRTHQ